MDVHEAKALVLLVKETREIVITSVVVDVFVVVVIVSVTGPRPLARRDPVCATEPLRVLTFATMCPTDAPKGRVKQDEVVWELWVRSQPTLTAAGALPELLRFWMVVPVEFPH